MKKRIASSLIVGGIIILFASVVLYFSQESQSTLAVGEPLTFGGNDEIVIDQTLSRVGIGTPTPGDTLEVNGNMTFCGTPTHRITNVADPTANSDVATKGYVDAQGGGGGHPTFTWSSVKHFFITNTSYDGSLGGLTGGDAKCNVDANRITSKTYHVVRFPDTAWNANNIGLWNATYGETSDLTVMGEAAVSPGFPYVPYVCGDRTFSGLGWECGQWIGQQNDPWNQPLLAISGMNKYVTALTNNSVWSTRTGSGNNSCTSWTSTGDVGNAFGFNSAHIIGNVEGGTPTGCSATKKLLCVEN